MSERELDYYYQKVNIQLASQIRKIRKSQEIREFQENP